MKTTQENKERSVATLTIRDAADMTPQGKKELADWLRRQAKMLVKEGYNYSSRFTGRYLLGNL